MHFELYISAPCHDVTGSLLTTETPSTISAVLRIKKAVWYERGLFVALILFTLELSGTVFCAVTFGSVCLVLKALKKAKKENAVAQLTLNTYEKLFTFGLAPNDSSLLKNVAIEDSKSILQSELVVSERACM